jgi:5-methylcytosine-specific restriction endonuclease McrA
MNTCRKCSKQFKTHVIIGGKPRNFGNRKFCIECSPFKSGNKIDITKRHTLNCIQCAAPLQGNATLFCSKVCKHKHHYKKDTSKNTYACQQGRALLRKSYFVKLLGGKCVACGYHKNLAALHFHHKNPTDKKFSLDARIMSGTSIADLRTEIIKCELLCSNCHMELHYPYLNLDLDSLSSLL